MAASKEELNSTLDQVANLIADSAVEAKPASIKPLEQVIVLLRLKAMEHALCAIELEKCAAPAEAIIILRSAYEAIVVALYLEQKPSKYEHYLAHTYLVQLRNLMEVVELARDDVDPADIKKLEEELEETRERIEREGYLSHYPNLTRTDLTDVRALKKFTSGSQFVKFGSIKSEITISPKMQWLTGAFQMYNVGSQVTHSHLDVLMSMYARPRMPHYLYSNGSIIRWCIIMISHTFECIVERGMMSDAHKTEIDENLKKAFVMNVALSEAKLV